MSNKASPSYSRSFQRKDGHRARHARRRRRFRRRVRLGRTRGRPGSRRVLDRTVLGEPRVAEPPAAPSQASLRRIAARYSSVSSVIEPPAVCEGGDAVGVGSEEGRAPRRFEETEICSSR